MDIETAAAPTEVPEAVAPAGFGEEAPVAAPEAPEPAEATSEERPRTWETVQEELEADETLASEYKAHLEEVRRASRKEGHSEAQKRLQPILEQNRQFLSASSQGIKAVEQTLREAIEDGADARQITKALQSNPEAWAAWNDHRFLAGEQQGAARFLVTLVGEDRALGDKFFPRIQDVANGADAWQVVAADFIDAVIGEREKAAEEKGYKRGLKAGQSGQTEAEKAKTRNGQGPSGAQTQNSGASGYRTKHEARVLHTQGKLSHQEMRQVNRSNLPEQ